MPDRHAKDVRDTLEMWKHQYDMPDKVDEKIEQDPKFAYAPPTSDVKGISISLGLIATFAFTFYHALFGIDLGDTSLGNVAHCVCVWGLLEFLFTGLFITTHDAMHGTIAYKNRLINDLIGHVAISLYAMFDYDVLHRKHWEHHNHTGVVGKDPDFHDGNPNVALWFFRFMREYLTASQVVKLLSWVTFLQSVGAPYVNLVTFFLTPGLVSAVRLFYVGTYLPHHPNHGPGEVMEWQKARSAPQTRLVSFFKCYHFDYHWEHHRWPYAPWWELWKCKEVSKAKQATEEQQRQSAKELERTAST